jgi:hypothetical protein
MSDLYVDPFYWEFGYAVGDQDLQPIEAVPSTVTVTAQGSLGFVKSLSAVAQSSDGAGLNESTLNSVAPAELPGQAPTATVTATLEVIRLFFIAGEAFSEVTSSAELDKDSNAAGSVQATVDTDAALSINVILVGEPLECDATAQANLRPTVNLVGAITATVTAAPAAAAVTKPFVASGDAVVNTIAVALLGKRLGGFGSTSVTTIANSAIVKAMASSAAVVTSATATAQVGKPFAASAQARVTAQPPLAIGKPFTAVAQAVATLVGRTVLLRFVPVEIADRSTYDLHYSVLYAEAELIEQISTEVSANPTVDVLDGRISVDVDYTSIFMEAELVEELELEVQW